MKLFYRDIKKEDLPIWEKLAKSEFLEDDFCDEKYLLEIWEKLKGWILLSDNGEWIGCCFIDSNFHKYNSNGIHFLESCIFPKFRGQGYAKYLAKIRFDASIGYRKSICINPDNKASIAVATKYGFKELEPHKSWIVYICEKDYYPQELKKLELEYIK